MNCALGDVAMASQQTMQGCHYEEKNSSDKRKV